MNQAKLIVDQCRFYDAEADEVRTTEVREHLQRYSRGDRESLDLLAHTLLRQSTGAVLRATVHGRGEFDEFFALIDGIEGVEYFLPSEEDVCARVSSGRELTVSVEAVCAMVFFQAPAGVRWIVRERTSSAP